MLSIKQTQIISDRELLNQFNRINKDNKPCQNQYSKKSSDIDGTVINEPIICLKNNK